MPDVQRGVPRAARRAGRRAAAHGIELWAAHVVDRVAAGGRWHCADGCGAAGAVDDPSSSPLAVAAVLDGRRLYARRAELQASHRRRRPERAAALARSIEQRVRTRADAARTPARAPRRRARDGRGRTRRRGAARHRRRAGPAGVRADRSAVRDTLYALAVGATRRPAEALWALLARTLPDRGESKRLCCLRSRPTPAATGRWPGCRWRPRCAATATIGWPACSTRRCSPACGPSRFGNWRAPATGWPSGSACGCRRGADVRADEPG